MKKLMMGLVMVLCLAMMAPAAMAVPPNISLCPGSTAPTPFQFQASGVAYWNLCGFVIKAEGVKASLFVNGTDVADVMTAADGSYTVMATLKCVNGGKFYNETFTFLVKLDYSTATLPSDQHFTSPSRTVYPYCCCSCCFQKYRIVFNATALTCVDGVVD